MLWLLPGIPLFAGLVCLLGIRNGWRRAALVFAAVSHFVLTCAAWRSPASFASHGWIGLDNAGLLFLGISSLLFLLTVLHLARDDHYFPNTQAPGPTGLWATTPAAVLGACLSLFLATMTLCALSRHLGLLWVAVEGTTLATAPLIYYRRDASSLEATWKYLVLCSVGIAVALLGNFFIAAAGHEEIGLSLDSLRRHATALNPVWLKAAFLFLIVGYGTKMGLAPMHTWLPDAHSEAPAPVSALLSGALLNCAFLAVLRVHAVLVAAGLADFSRSIFILFGGVSLVVAALFIVGQVDYKRLLAYSSVENMGILSLAAGVSAGFGGLFHALNHSLAKGAMFLVAGGILARCGSTSVRGSRGLASRTPLFGALWLVGFLALSGLPPFGMFFSKLAILKKMVEGGHWGITVLFLMGVAVAFIAMSRVVLVMVFDPGDKEAENGPSKGRGMREALAPLALLALALAAGMILPDGVRVLIESAAREVGLP